MKNKNQTRFVPVKDLQELYRQVELLNNKINSYNPNHCKVCGDTTPDDGFYPLWSMTVGADIKQTSGLMCNKCAWPKKEI